MRVTPFALALGLLTVTAAAAPQLTPRKFVILGDQAFEHLVSGDDPVAAENESVKIVAARFVPEYVNGRDSKIHATFGFTVRQPLKIKQVVVEEVSAATPELAGHG